MSPASKTRDGTFAYTSNTVDPLHAAREVREGPVEDLGTFEEDWGVWALLAFSGAIALVGGLMVHRQMGKEAFIAALFFFLALFPLALGAVQPILIGFPGIGSLLMSLAGILAIQPGVEREYGAFGLVAVGIALMACGAYLVLRGYTQPKPMLPSESASSVFRWQD